jgi:vitamin B12 transporter
VRSLREDFIWLFGGANPLNVNYVESGNGASAKLTGKFGFNTCVLGADADDRTLKNDQTLDGQQTLRKSAVYANDTLTFGKLAISPGLRYDQTNQKEKATSPSLGFTYRVGETTILRAFTARGFNSPPFYWIYQNNSVNPDLTIEKVTSYQIGAENASLRYLWLKVTAFRNDVMDAIDTSAFPNVNNKKEKRQGIEVEARTIPVFDTTLKAGANIIQTRNLDTGETILDIPTQVYNLELVYDDKHSFKADLTGLYINWNMADYHEAKYGSMIFDLNLTDKVYERKDTSLEAFVNVHNLLNGDQYWDIFYVNPKRWLEGGVRYNF